MSYEYNVFGSVPSDKLYEHLKDCMALLPDVRIAWSNHGSCAFSYLASTSDWDSDMDLSLSGDRVLLCVHSGNTGIVDHLIECLARMNIHADFQEL